MTKAKSYGGKSTVTLILFIAIVAILLRFAIEQLMKTNIAQNESNAAVMLKSISAALENYAKDNNGIFPATLTALTEAEPPYLNKNYISDNFSLKGYNFTCLRLEPSGYRCQAAPGKCNATGKQAYTVTTGGVIVSEECSRKE